MVVLESEAPITDLLRRYNDGDQNVWQELVPHIYDDLRRLAHHRMRHERWGHTLSTTAVVNECYLRLVQNRHLAAGDRGEFMALAGKTMRRLLVDYARSRKRLKRGRDLHQVALKDAAEWLTEHEAAELLSLDEALQSLEKRDDRASRVVEMHFFGGLSFEEIGAVLSVSTRTVSRTWLAARAWLRKEIDLGMRSAGA